MKALLLGIGNPLRRDDGAGAAVLQRLRGQAGLAGVTLTLEPGDGARIIDLWQGCQRVWVVDASSCDAEPGSIRRLDAILEEEKEAREVPDFLGGPGVKDAPDDATAPSE